MIHSLCTFYFLNKSSNPKKDWCDSRRWPWKCRQDLWKYLEVVRAVDEAYDNKDSSIYHHGLDIVQHIARSGIFWFLIMTTLDMCLILVHVDEVLWSEDYDGLDMLVIMMCLCYWSSKFQKTLACVANSISCSFCVGFLLFLPVLRCI
jgi:hypothetical protein